MPTYRVPGVYFEWLDAVRAIEGARTDIAGLVGVASRGPLHTPVQIESFPQFTSTFGGHIADGYLACAVEGFFTNGGARCWVVRVADPATATAGLLDLKTPDGAPSIQLEASSVGAWSASLRVSIIRITSERFTMLLQSSDGVQEAWRGLSMIGADSRFVGTVLNDPVTGSHLVRVAQIFNPAGSPDTLPADAIFSGLEGGTDGLRTLTLNHFTGDAVHGNTTWGLATLAAINEIAVVAIPDAVAPPRIVVHQPPPPRDCTKIIVHPPDPIVPEPELRPVFGDDGVSVIQEALVRHCEAAKDRTCILDPPSRDMTAQQILAWRNQFDSSYAALYFPWIEMSDPLELDGLLRAVPPCGHVAGVYARCDLGVGVHKPPANELVEGAKNLTVAIDDVDHGDLNDAAINAIRAINGRGIRIAGARTLSSDTLLLFLNVRRLLIMIERSIDRASQWTVFEPNNRELWREIARVARAFLDRLWKRGMLDGATADQAYSVVCDETTNPPAQTDVGLMVCEIGVLPPWPAEFVVVRIGRTEDRTEILETTGLRNG